MQGSGTDETPCSFWGLTQTRLNEWLSDPARHLLVSEADTALAGTGSYVRGGPFQEHLAEISVAVAPNARRAGTARALIAALETDAANSGIHVLKALIWVRNTPSRKLFERCGYHHRATLYAEFMSEQFGEIDDCVYYKRLD